MSSTRTRMFLAIAIAQQRKRHAIIRRRMIDFSFLKSQPKRNSPKGPGQMILDLFAGSEVSFQETLGMSKGSFILLKTELQTYGWLQDSKHLTSEEQLGIYLHWQRENKSNRSMQQSWNRSAETISK